jgi:magnesium-dependent phosphatase 1
MFDSWIWPSKMDNKSLGWRQERNDLEVAGWGVHKPYILFSRHFNLKSILELSFPVFWGRWNEMVIYPQVQESLLVVRRLTDEQLETTINDTNAHLHYEKKIGPWNITVPDEAKTDFRVNGEFFI